MVHKLSRGMGVVRVGGVRIGVEGVEEEGVVVVERVSVVVGRISIVVVVERLSVGGRVWVAD